MKKIVITLVASGFAFIVNAQQLPLLPKQQPLKQFRFRADSVANNNFLFKTPDGLSANNLSLRPDSLRRNATLRLNVPSDANVDNMPIARMQGNTNMPIAQTDRTGYSMPVAGMSRPQVYTMKNSGNNAEVLPFFEGKPPLYYELKKYPDATAPADDAKKK